MASNSRLRRAGLVAGIMLLADLADTADPGAQAAPPGGVTFPPVIVDDPPAASATDFPPVVDHATPVTPGGTFPPVVEDKAAPAPTPDVPPVADTKGSTGTHKKSDATDDAFESRSPEKHKHHATEHHDDEEQDDDHPLREKVRRAAKQFGGNLLRGLSDR